MWQIGQTNIKGVRAVVILNLYSRRLLWPLQTIVLINTNKQVTKTACNNVSLEKVIKNSGASDVTRTFIAVTWEPAWLIATQSTITTFLNTKFNNITASTSLFPKQTAPFCFLIKITHQSASLPRLSSDLLSQEHTTFSACRWVIWPQMEGGCRYVKKIIMDSLQAVFVQLGKADEKKFKNHSEK